MTAPKVVCQYRRARKLAAVVTAAYPHDPDAYDMATFYGETKWRLAADIAGITPPSEDTIALTIELLRERTTQP
jgi:hypothetical protein